MNAASEYDLYGEEKILEERRYVGVSILIHHSMEFEGRTSGKEDFVVVLLLPLLWVDFMKESHGTACRRKK